MLFLFQKPLLIFRERHKPKLIFNKGKNLEMKNINMKKAAFAAALLYVGYKKMAGNSAINTAALALGAVSLASQVPVVSDLV